MTFSTYVGIAFLTNPGDMWTSSGTGYSSKPLAIAHSLVYAGVSVGVSR